MDPSQVGSHVISPQSTNAEEVRHNPSIILLARPAAAETSHEDLHYNPLQPITKTIVAEPEALDVDEVETQAIPQTSPASALESETWKVPLETAENLLIPPTPVDIVDGIKGMYRILDLVSEKGSGGLGT